MSGLGRTHVSNWDSKEDSHHHHSSLTASSGAYYRDKESEPVRFNSESNGSRRSGAETNQHPGEARSRSIVSQSNDNSYDSERDDTRQQIFPRNGSRSNSMSRSRSRSPVYRGKHKTRTLVSPTPIREFNKRGSGHHFDQSNDHGLEDDTRKPRKTKYHTDDFRGEAMMTGARFSVYNTKFPEDNSRREHLHDNGFSDPRLRRHRSEFTGVKDTQRRNGDGEGQFHRTSNIPCKFLAAGFCRNGNYCRFSHHGAGRKQPQDKHFYRQDSNNHNKWNDVERLDNGRLGGIEVSRASKGVSEPNRNSSSWIDDMEMSPDWNYGVQSLKNPVKEEHSVGIIGQSSQSQVLKGGLVSHNEQSSGMFSHGGKTMVEKPIAASHQSYSHPVNVTPVQAFSQNHNVLPYQSSLTAGGSQQVLATAAADLSVGSNLSNVESGKVYQNNHQSTVERPVLVQNTVSKEQLDKITSISATIAQFLANGEPIPELVKALQMPLHSESSMDIQPNQATTTVHSQSNVMSSNPNQLCGLGMNIGAGGVPVVTASQVNNVSGIQDLTLNPKGCEENRNKKTHESSKEEEGKKTGEDTNDAENIVDEDEDDVGSDKENKKGIDPKEMRAFKFALVEVVKELLNPTWKEGKMDKDGYKNIVKKVVEKVTVTMQSGSVPQTQENIDHYLSASKPKLTKLVQAYISKIKKT
ncbi:hypothetical protein CARUB_v10013105mg [Capsella rubella]|uniref:C3H1-type domain-containing protein n=1 Tax=Capsella rubella TaxID=81985 RepID=R0G3V2_9BRAS|nr:zinc finger CCCH domain-containing protein 38 [Capsella rubella]EOA30000.1 hypothetical protein CARUB_v10013105mg [Capsella rubella]EOA30001.1 hypothetical protein CARUB_v10013105mg [Capsella rubella]EOA30002.1 hypothetical protein CARUB_v10013105mg [Capsella rubella]